jgi:hypothetical protein
MEEHIMNESVIKAGSSELIRVWIATEPINKEIFVVDIKREKRVCCRKVWKKKIAMYVI